MALAPGIPYRFGPDDPNFAEDDLVTTQMCAAVHLDGKFANFTARQLGTLPHTAVWPNLRLDYATLLRHANFSRGRRALRDLTLMLWMLGLVLAWVSIIWLMLAGHVEVLPGFLGAIAVTLAVYLGAGIVVWFFYRETMFIVGELTERPAEGQQRLDDFPGLPSRAPGMPPKELSAAQKGAQLGPVYSLARVLAGADGWYQGFREELRARYRELAGRAPQREKSTQNQMTYLQNLEHANVLLFDRKFTPFELAGEPLDSWQITIDVGKFVDSGKHLTALSAVDLHHKLLECVPDGSLPLLDARSMYVVSGMQPIERDVFDHWRRCLCICDCDCAGNSECACGCRAALEAKAFCGPSQQRLADWRAIVEQQIPAALTGDAAKAWVEEELQSRIADRRLVRNPGPDPRSVAGEQNNPEGWYLEHPEYVINQADLDKLIIGPPEGGRVYAYFRKFSWRGQVVVGAAVRVYRALNTLYIEFDAHAMPPLHAGFDNFLYLPSTERTIARALWKTTVARTPGLLFQSMRSMYMLWCTPSGRMGVTRELQHKREQEGRIDYGSTLNLRLEVADRDRLWQYPFVDEVDHADVLRDRVFDCVENYLQGYGVDLTEYRKKVWLIRTRRTDRRRRADPTIPPGSQPDD